jgi:hypothetical protein
MKHTGERNPGKEESRGREVASPPLVFFFLLLTFESLFLCLFFGLFLSSSTPKPSFLSPFGPFLSPKTEVRKRQASPLPLLGEEAANAQGKHTEREEEEREDVLLPSLTPT